MRKFIAFLGVIASAIAATAQEPLPRSAFDNDQAYEYYLNTSVKKDEVHLYGYEPGAPEQKKVGLQLVRLTSLEAIPEPVKNACYSVAKVVLDQGGGAQMGSGTYVGNGLWVTNRHVVVGNPGRYFVQLKDGTTFPARVVKVSNGSTDIAVVETQDMDKYIPPVPISDLQPSPGMTVYPSGFDEGSLKRHVVWPARIVKIYQDGDIESVGINGRKGSISGNSGGPTFTEAGELLAPLYANGGRYETDTSTGMGTCITADWLGTRTFLLPFRERLVNSLRQLTNGGCYGGIGCQPQQQIRMMPQQQYIPQQQYMPQQYMPQQQVPTIPSFKPELVQPQPQPQPQQVNSIPGPVGPQGPQGLPGPQGPKGDPGPPGVAQVIPPIDIIVVDTETGQRRAIGQLKFDGSMRTLEIPWNNGSEARLGFKPEDLSPEQLAALVTVVERRIQPKVTEDLIQQIQSALPPIRLQPTYRAKDGTLKPTGDPIAYKVGGVYELPPTELEVISPEGRKTKTQAPLGEPLRLQMNGKVTTKK